MRVNDDLVDELLSRGAVPPQRLVQLLERAHRDERVLVEDADQHSHAGVYLAEDDGELRDPGLDP